MVTINELQDEVVEEFQDFSDWMDKYQTPTITGVMSK